MDREPGSVPRHAGRIGLRQAGFRRPDPAWVIGKHGLLGVRAIRAHGRTELHPAMRRIPYQWMGVHYQDRDDQPFLLLHNSGGGMIEGDAAECQIIADPGTRMLVATTGATKYYKCEHGHSVEERLEVVLAPGCVFEYLPEEAIPYARTRATRVVSVDTDPDSRVFLSDILCAGRISFDAGETFAFDSLNSETSLRVGGRLVWLDRLIVDSPSAVSDLRALWGGHAVMGTVLAYAPDLPDDIVDRVTAGLPPAPAQRAAATLLDGNLLCVRILAAEAWQVHDAVYRVWSAVRPSIAGKPARPILKP